MALMLHLAGASKMLHLYLLSPGAFVLSWLLKLLSTNIVMTGSVTMFSLLNAESAEHVAPIFPFTCSSLSYNVPNCKIDCLVQNQVHSRGQ